MRVDLLVLFTSCALLVCASDASGNPITPHDKTNIQSLAESQEGIPVKRLLSTKKTKNDEERGPFDKMFKPIKDKLLPRKDKFLTREEELNQILTTTDGSVLAALQHEKMTSVIKAYEKDPYVLVKKLLSNKKIEEKQLALALHEYSKVKRGDGYGLIDALLTHHPDGTYHDDPYARAFEILMKKKPDDPNDPFTMSFQEISALDDYIAYRRPRIGAETAREIKSDRLSSLLSTLVTGAKSNAKLVSMIARHHEEAGAKKLEDKLYEHLLSSLESNQFQYEVVEKLYTFGDMEPMGVKLLTSQELDMLRRFYVKATISNPDVPTKVKTLRSALKDDNKKIALLLSEAMKDQDKAIVQVAKVLETEYFRQLRDYTTPDEFEKMLENLDGSDRGLLREFVERFRECNRNER